MNSTPTASTEITTTCDDSGSLVPNGCPRKPTYETRPDFEAPKRRRERQDWYECSQCKRWYASSPYNLNRGQVCCSRPCAAARTIALGIFKGDKNPSWKGGVSNDNMRYKRRDKARHPEHHAAREKVRRAIRSGKLVKLPCENCGEQKSTGHHEDYSKPLDVIWLCRPCHDAEHAKEKAA